MVGIVEEIERAIAGRYPIIYLQTSEEERAITAVRALAKKRFIDLSVVEWSCTSGFDTKLGEGRSVGSCIDPLEALQSILQTSSPGLYIMKDLVDFMGQPGINRGLRDLYQRLRTQDDLFVFIVSSEPEIPDSLRKEIYQISIQLPGNRELLGQIENVADTYPKRKISTEMLKEIAFAMNGLTLDEAAHVMHQICSGEESSIGAISEHIAVSKRRMASFGTVSLEYVPETVAMEQLGGLDRLKGWIEARRGLFSHQAQVSDMPIPRGILIMGISGCGKSLCAKVVADSWKLPLYRLDMNLIYSDLYGNPEAAFYKAVQTAEAAAPAVIWIDEIENGMGLLDRGNSNQSHIFSAFLTWMQEKHPWVFVAATANRIESLPAELIRKGRFDQVFFCDLPNDEERAEILRIHIKANKQDPNDFDIEHLTRITREWNAAELEQAVQGGRINASNENRAFTTMDIARYIQTIVPLSETMSEQIKKIRDWAWDRATPASKGKGKGRELSFTEEG